MISLLSKGEDLAKAFTDELNAAQARIAEEATRQAAETAAAAKRSDLVSLLDSAFAYCAKYYPSLGIAEGNWDNEDLEAIAQLVIMALDIEAMKKPKSKAAAKSRDVDVFNKFFKDFGLLN